MSDDPYKLERLLFNINTLTELGEEVTAHNDFPKAVKASLFMVMGTFSASKGIILKYDFATSKLNHLASKGIESSTGIKVPLDHKSASVLARSNKPVDLKGKGHAVENLGEARETFEKFSGRILVPLTVGEELLGVVVLSDKFNGGEYIDYDLQLLSNMSQHISSSMNSQLLLHKLTIKYTENKELYENLRQIYYDTILSFATAIDAKDAYTRGHSHRVSAYSNAIARRFGWTDIDIEAVTIGGLLHDIGKLTVDKSIINKVDPLTNYESVELNSHPSVGYDILSKIKFPWKDISLMARNHHEKLDGTGYPDHLSAGDIHIGAKIMTLSDSFDAMTTNRPYRPRLPIAVAIKELKENTSQFDGDVLKSFMDTLRFEALGEVDEPLILPRLMVDIEGPELAKLCEF